MAACFGSSRRIELSHCTAPAMRSDVQLLVRIIQPAVYDNVSSHDNVHDHVDVHGMRRAISGPGQPLSTAEPGGAAGILPGVRVGRGGARAGAEEELQEED